jgi:Circadian oscillating protein COP23
MNRFLTTSALTFGTIAMFAGTVLLPEANAQEQPKFICSQSFDKQTNRRLPTTFAWTTRGKIAVVRWESQQFPGYPPERRCQEVSPRFQRAFDDGSLKVLRNGNLQGKPVICAVKKETETCSTSNILMTLRPTDNSFAMLNNLKDIFSGRQVGPIRHSSGDRQAAFEVDIDQFLRTAPVEKE